MHFDTQEDLKRKESDAQRRKEAREYFLNYFHRLSEQREVWACEAVKHIALISLAGLGGIFAILAGNAATNRGTFIWPAMCFAFSSALCVLDLYCGVIVRDKWMKKVYGTVRELESGINPEDVNTDTANLGVWNKVANGIGWFAAGLTVTGGVWFFLVI